MSAASELALRLVAYDARLARDLLGWIVAELGGGERSDPAEARAFLERPDLGWVPEVGDATTTTAEWKADFGHREALRALAVELAGRLDHPQ